MACGLSIWKETTRNCYDGTRCESQPVVCGVPHGSILGPLLFILLLNDIDYELNSCKILLYADDTVVFTSSKNQETNEENLNSDLSNLAASLSISEKGKLKSSCLVHPKRCPKLRKLNIIMRNEPINEVETYRGVKIDKSLNYVEQKNKIYKEAMRKVKLLSHWLHSQFTKRWWSQFSYTAI